MNKKNTWKTPTKNNNKIYGKKDMWVRVSEWVHMIK